MKKFSSGTEDHMATHLSVEELISRRPRVHLPNACVWHAICAEDDLP